MSTRMQGWDGHDDGARTNRRIAAVAVAAVVLAALGALLTAAGVP